MATHSSKIGWKAAPVKMVWKLALICVFQLARKVWSCNWGNKISTPCNQPCHRSRTSRTTAKACETRSSSNSAEAISLVSSSLPKGKLPLLKKSSNSLHNLILLRMDNSMLMRSMPSVYSAMRGKGITTSSLILKALVCLLMAAVFLRSNQNFLRASGLTAMKPSPLRELAMRTTSEVTLATSSALSPAMSPTNTILGRPPRLDLVV